jgi:hypothetical protein
MKVRTVWITLTLAVILTLMAGGAGALPDQAASAPTAPRINYQGRLTDPAGVPLTGTYLMQFQIYDDPAVGALLWESGVLNIEVDHGLFNVALNIDPADFNGQGLWLRMYVDGEWLSPRQELTPVPYALSLRPGAEVKAEPTGWEGSVFKVTMDGAYPVAKGIWGTAATGSAVYGSSSGGWGVQGYSEDGYGVYGVDAGTSQARGYGGYFTSQNGVGVYGYSSAASVGSNAYMPGVYGRSASGVGVFGVGDGLQAGVRGQSTNGNGVYGFSTNSTGIYGQSQGATTEDYGVYGRVNNGTAYGVYGYQASPAGGLGVYGKNEGGGSGVSGYNAGAGNGTWGYSVNYHGVGGGTGRVDNNYGLYTLDNIYSLNYHTSGAMMQIVQNGDTGPLELGDVVVVAGLGQALTEGGAPVIQVSKASEANSPAVIGVVASSFSPEWLADPSTTDPTAAGPGRDIPESGPGPVAPGGYMLIVIQGPAQVKASALSGSIQPGSLLSTGAEAGLAARAAQVTVEGISTPIPGTVFGKALESLDAGQKLIYVFVTLQ